MPILGDLSRRHAIIRREGEGYSIEAVRPVRLDGRPVQRSAPLWDGSTIELGDAVRLRFRRPHPLSATARLEFVSPHRTQPSTDAVLLMAETCILGPASTSHVVAPRWRHEVVLFRQASRIGMPNRRRKLRSMEQRDQAAARVLRPQSRVEGEEFAFSLEPLDR